MPITQRAVILLSGGLDSATALAIAKHDGFEAYAMSFSYGQRHGFELACAAKTAARMGVKQHVTVGIDLRAFGGSALTADIAVPKGRSAAEMGGGEIPITYVPARNTIFLSFALAWAETLGSSDVFIGVNALDYSGYPDCRPEFIDGFEALAGLATKAGSEGERFKVHAPLQHMSKAEIAAEAQRLGLDAGMSWSCYDPVGDLHCGRCDSCRLRSRGFAEAGIADPTRYATAA